MSAVLGVLLFICIGFAAGIGGGAGFALMMVRQMDKKIDDMAVRFDQAITEQGEHR